MMRQTAEEKWMKQYEFAICQAPDPSPSPWPNANSSKRKAFYSLCRKYHTRFGKNPNSNFFETLWTEALKLHSSST